MLFTCIFWIRRMVQVLNSQSPAYQNMVPKQKAREECELPLGAPCANIIQRGIVWQQNWGNLGMNCHEYVVVGANCLRFFMAGMERGPHPQISATEHWQADRRLPTLEEGQEAG